MTRHLRRGLIALAIVLLWVTGSFLTQWLAAQSVGPDESRPPPASGTALPAVPVDPVDPDAPAPAPRSAPVVDRELGVQLSAHHATRAARARRVIERLHDAGAGWIRVDVGWSTLQPDGPGAFEKWYADLIDEVLASAREHDLQVLLMFWSTPAWASPDGSHYAPPTDPDDYARAISRAAQRWGDLVDAWEIWNEPNFEGFFEGADPVTYTRMLCAAYPAVKEHDDAPVLFGGIMYNDAPWLRRSYEAGAGGCFDALATHPYIGPSDAEPETPSVGAVWRLTSTPMVHQVMEEWGDGDKRIWITELGWSSGPDNEGNAWDRPVTAAQQADFLGRAVRLVRAEYPYVGPIIWYRDVDGPSRSYQDGFGLMRADLSPKPSMRAFEASAHGR